MQSTLFIKVLPRIAQVESDIRHRRRARIRRGGWVYKPVLGRRGLFIAKGTESPLPGDLFVALGQAPWRVQVVGVHGVVLAAGVGGYRHGACGRGQVDVVGAAGAVGPACAQLVQQAAVFIVVVLKAQFVCGAGRCGAGVAAPQVAKEGHQAGHEAGVGLIAHGRGELGLGFEQALAQGVVHVAGGGAGVAGAYGHGGQAVGGVELVAAQAVAGHGAVGVVVVVDGAGGAPRRTAYRAPSRMWAYAKAHTWACMLGMTCFRYQIGL